MDEMARGCFAVRPGDGNDGAACLLQMLSIVGGELLQCFDRIVNKQNAGRIYIRGGFFAIDDHECCVLLECCIYIVMPIEVSAFDGEKDLAGLDGARVDTDAGEFGCGIGFGCEPMAFGDALHPLRRPTCCGRGINHGHWAAFSQAHWIRAC